MSGSKAFHSLRARLSLSQLGIDQALLGQGLVHGGVVDRLEPRTLHYRLHNLSARYNAGMGVQDEAREALAQLLVESVQEILARLNRDLWKAPRLAAIGPISGHEAELRAVGLSGAPAAGSV